MEVLVARPAIPTEIDSSGAIGVNKNLVSISPFFIVKDLPTSIAYYVDRLGFELEFQGPDGEVTSTSTEKFTLSADGKSLTVVRHSESPRGPQDSTLVFNK